METFKKLCISIICTILHKSIADWLKHIVGEKAKANKIPLLFINEKKE